LKNTLILLLLLFPFLLTAQGWQPVGTRSASMAGSSVTLTDTWSYFHNPGATAGIKEIQIGMSYQNRFLLKEFQTQALVASIPLKKGVLSLGTLYNGAKEFRTLRSGIGYALQLTDIFSLGVQINHQLIQLPSYYGSKNGATAELGLKAMINPKWSIGMSVFNLGRARLSTYGDDRLTTVLRLGSAYIISEKLTAAFEVEKNVDYPASFKLGMDYNAANNFFIRAGARINPLLFSFGFGYKVKNWAIDAGTEWHTFLGWLPTLGVSYKFAKNKINPTTVSADENGEK
jgi:hypothetical protein